jgi:hypothetical protein
LPVSFAFEAMPAAIATSPSLIVPRLPATILRKTPCRVRNCSPEWSGCALAVPAHTGGRSQMSGAWSKEMHPVAHTDATQRA